MKESLMRVPLIKAGAVLLVFVLLAYLTSVSPDGSVLNSFGQIIIGAFRLVQWALAMAIGLAVCIAFLIGVFLFAVYQVNKETAASMYQAVKVSIRGLCQPLFTCCSSFQCRETPCAGPAPLAEQAVDVEPKEDLRALVAAEIKKVVDSQQTLGDQFQVLNNKITEIEEKSANSKVAEQLDTITAELAASGKLLENVQQKMITLEGKLGETAQSLHAITPERMLGDIPARLTGLEERGVEQPFDPAPLSASIAALQKELEEVKKKSEKSTGGSRAKKKA